MAAGQQGNWLLPSYTTLLYKRNANAKLRPQKSPPPKGNGLFGNG